MQVLSDNHGLVDFEILLRRVQFKFTEVLYDKLKTPNRFKWTKRRFSS